MFFRSSVLLSKTLFIVTLFLVLSFTSFNSLYSQTAQPHNVSILINLIDFLCGDANADGDINLGDVLCIANYYLKGGPAPVPLDAADVNCDDEINLSDVIYLANYLLKGGSPPCWFEIPVNFDTCKTFQKGDATDSTPPNQDCIEYQYDGENVLSIKHINAGFNCCPDEIKAIVNIEDNIITIKEKEYLYSGGCYCLCLFDLDYDISGVSPEVYTIKVIEPYLPEGNEPLEFTVDLSSSTSGRYCVDRSGYPWTW